MVNQPTSSEDNAAQLEAQAELLHVVLDESPYPWLADEAVDSYGAQIETAGQDVLEISDEEARVGWQRLSATLSATWGAAGVMAPLNQKLIQKFAGRLPADVIARIGERAQQLMNGGEAAGQNVLDQMLACVQDVLSHVANDDLRVMGRPMAMAMRGSSADEFVEATIKSVRSAEWAALSPIEQARLGLAAARYAISQGDSPE